MESKVLVTGATGLVGKEVVQALVGRGVAVKATSRSGTEIPGAEAAIFDFGDPDTFDAALEDVDRVFLLVPSEAVARGPELVPPFIQATKTAGVRKVVCMTGMTSDRPEADMYPVERSVQESGIEWTLLRPNWFNQNFAPGFYLESIKGAGGLFLPAADAKTSFVDTRDIGEMAAVALTEEGHDGMAYTLTGPEALSHTEACAILSRAAGREITYTPISDDQMREALRARGLPHESIEELVGLYRIVREGLCAPTSDDIPSVLGRPAIGFAEYAADHAELMR